jgi:seryl-tRNA synthetase
MLWVPNIPHQSVPDGPDDSHNINHPPQGVPRPEFDFEPKAHWDLGPALGIIDFERGVRLSGSRFYVLKGVGARLQRALIQFMLNMHVNEHGYTEIYPPFMVRSEMFVGAAQLPKFADNIYRDAEEDFMWLGTAEIALTNLHRDEILDEADLPINYVAYTPCFRREKMSAGRDVRGIKRGHQFDKVEMYKFTTPDQSYAALEELVRQASDVCEALQLPYRKVEMVTGDLGFAAAKKYDLEVWAAGCQEWLEVSSCSNCEDFQARRANVRYRPEGGGKVQFAHTLNGSGLALPRIMIAVIENNQQADGSIVVPEVLRPGAPVNRKDRTNFNKACLTRYQAVQLLNERVTAKSVYDHMGGKAVMGPGRLCKRKVIPSHRIKIAIEKVLWKDYIVVANKNKFKVIKFGFL